MIIIMAITILSTVYLHASERSLICQKQPNNLELWLQQHNQFDPQISPIPSIIDEKPAQESSLHNYKKVDSIREQTVLMSQLYQKIATLQKNGTNEISDIQLLEDALNKVSKGIAHKNSLEIEKNIEEIENGIDIVWKRIKTRQQLENQITKNVLADQSHSFSTFFNSFGNCLRNFSIFKQKKDR